MTETEFERRVIDMTDDMYRVTATLLHRYHDRQDAVQEAICKAWKNLSRLRDEEKFRAWLMHILVNECRALWRSSRETPQAEPPDIPDQRDAYENAFRDDELHKAIMTLPEKIRLTIVLFYMDGFSQREIAQTLRVPEGTVASRLNQGRKRLKALLKREV